VSGWEVQLDPGVDNWTRSLQPSGPTIEELSELADWAIRKTEVGPQGSTVADARSMLYFDSLPSIRVYFHAEPSDAGKGLVRVLRVLPGRPPGGQ